MFHYERESRTAHSECFVVENEAGSRARVDLHYAPPIVYATLSVPEDWAEVDIQDVIADIDHHWVLSSDPLREDFIVTVWRGQEVGVYSQDQGVQDE